MSDEFSGYPDWQRWLHNFEYRRGPVPRTGRHGCSNFCRHPSHHPALKNFSASLDDGGPRLRPSRCIHNLPDPWDDLWRQDALDRSWKRYRRAQHHG